LCFICVPRHDGEAGYIHSVGRLIQFRSAVKVSPESLKNSVAGFLARYHYDRRPIFFVPYSHEGFSGQDKGSPFLKGGLDDIKLYLNKTHVGNEILSKTLDDLQTTISEIGIKCVVAESDDYKSELADFVLEHKDPDIRSWFILMDSDLKNSDRFPSDKKYLVVYEQLFKNVSPYHWFDENKPAWVSHTTLPHSLAAAMINITRPNWPEGEVQMCDPFGGSGTVFLEGQKHDQVRVSSSDISESARIIAADNVNIFQLTPSEIRALTIALEEFKRLVSEGVGFSPNTRKKGKGKTISDLVTAAKLLSDETNGDCLDATIELWDRAKEFCTGNELFWRIRLYCCLRGLIRHKSGLARGTEIENKAIAVETEDLIKALTGLKGIVDARRARNFSNSNLFSTTVRGIIPVYGKYSIGVRPAPPRGEESDMFGSRSFVVTDVRELPKNCYDVIVADPPYGFNTDEITKDMAVLFQKMIKSIVEAISDNGGQIVLAVPEVSFTGKPIPAFVSPALMVQEIIRIGHECGRTMIKPAKSVPGLSSRYEPPYYWYAEKALKRAILHFWIAPKGLTKNATLNIPL
jgi:tRNA G10  N-methylase Trm11